VKVYLISTYGEEGAEKVRATLDKSKVLGLLADSLEGAVEIEYEENLAKFLLEDEIHTDGLNLGHGWGGYQLHIVELE